MFPVKAQYTPRLEAGKERYMLLYSKDFPFESVTLDLNLLLHTKSIFTPDTIKNEIT
jgi:hypothetical protein